MHKAIGFFYLRASEAGIILIVLTILFALYPEVYGRDHSSGVVGIFAGSLFALVWFYVLWGYLLTAALGYFVSGSVSSWNPQTVAAVSTLVFVAHTLGLISYLGIRMSLLSWSAWLLVVILSTAATLLILQHGSRAVASGG